MERIENITTPVTLRTFKTTKGDEYILKGLEKPISVTDMGGVRRHELNHFKLYKKVNNDGLDTFQLVGKKKKKSTYDFKKNTKHLTSIMKEAFNPATGALSEQTLIGVNVGGGKTIECNGDVFKMSGNIATNSTKNNPSINFDLKKGTLTPIAKRILKILSK